MKDNRRHFIKNTSLSFAGVSIGIGFSPKADPKPKKYLSGDALQELTGKSKIRISVAAPADASAAQLSFYKQAGLNHVALLTDTSSIDEAYYEQRKKYFSDAGLQVYGFNNIALLNLPGRDEQIELYKQHLRALGKAGIGYTTYSYPGSGLPPSGNGTARAGAVARVFNPTTLSNQQYTAKEMLANFTYFIKAVSPVAKEFNVKIGLLSGDPPAVKGSPQLFSSFTGYQRALEVVKSENLGICLSVGNWAQGGQGMGKDVFGMIEYFGKQKKLFEVRVNNFVNDSGFTESFVDGGSLDMYKVLKALKKINFDGILIPDHIPQMTAATPRANPAYDPSLAWTIGYVKCLRDRVEEEAAI